ncbi:succinyldiaminopimelate transaminase [Litorivicinus lipolyticus]|uniref:succinyldiaminopimelate transaminase n=1 Tax=Litorivicinus lipolyticus TaxID=418701 RepID=UPI003B5A6933
MNPRIDALHPYPFEKLRALVSGITPNPDLAPLSLGIGEPQHPPPQVAIDALIAQVGDVAHYPATLGRASLRAAIADWLKQRFALNTIDPDQQVLPVTGTREALFAVVQALVGDDCDIAMPNPFYQIYEGAALMAGATPIYLAADPSNDFKPLGDTGIPDYDRLAMMFICTPGNPSGKVYTSAELQQLIRLAQRHDFILVSDECYSEIYRDQAPAGLLQAAADMGLDDYRNCLAVGSLSKRSNLPGLRSGYMAGDAHLLKRFARYRTYHGCAMPGHHQAASEAAWGDEAHVAENRRLYRIKFDRAYELLADYLDDQPPAAGFYLWPKVPGGDDEGFTRFLLERQNLRVLPGRYLARDVDGSNPGAGHFRAALVSAPDTTETALVRLKTALDEWSARA